MKTTQDDNILNELFDEKKPSMNKNNIDPELISEVEFLHKEDKIERKTKPKKVSNILSDEDTNIFHNNRDRLYKILAIGLFFIVFVCIFSYFLLENMNQIQNI
jgi:hypothetical protein